MDEMKKLIVYGTGLASIKFVQQYGIKNICFFIENKKSIKEFYGKKVIMTEDAIGLEKREYIVVASSAQGYHEIKKNLETFGLIEFEDFIYWEIYKKKIAVIYGNCHTVPIKEALLMSKEFNQQYGFYPIKEIQVMQMEKNLDYNLPVFTYCDLLLHQSIREDNRYGIQYSSKYIISKVSDKCRTIAIPNLYGLPKCFYPQSYTVEGIVHEGANFFPYRDKYIDEYYMNGLGIKEIIDLLRCDDLINCSDVCFLMESFIEKVRKREEEWDIGMSNYIIKNYRKKQLFYDINHPTNEIFKFIAIEILKILKLDIIDTCIFDNLVSLDDYELPIYNSVKKSLRLDYENRYLRAKSKWRISSFAMDLEEYVEEYIRWNFCNR